VQASAIFYGDRGDELLDAERTGHGVSRRGRRRLGAELRPLADWRRDVRVATVRTGIVLARHGGALAKMLPLFRGSAAGRIGDGRHWMSWIHVDDIARLFLHALDSDAAGVLEGVAPQPATNREFTTTLCRALGVLENVPVPALAIRTLYGEMGAIVLESARGAAPYTRVGFPLRVRVDGDASASCSLHCGSARERCRAVGAACAGAPLAVLLRRAQLGGAHARVPQFQGAWEIDARDRRGHADRLSAAAERHSDGLGEPHRGQQPARPSSTRR
jgi:hypothetical protein